MIWPVKDEKNRAEKQKKKYIYFSKLKKKTRDFYCNTWRMNQMKSLRQF